MLQARIEISHVVIPSDTTYMTLGSLAGTHRRCAESVYGLSAPAKISRDAGSMRLTRRAESVDADSCRAMESTLYRHYCSS
jgi:hypothetical protein